MLKLSVHVYTFTAGLWIGAAVGFLAKGTLEADLAVLSITASLLFTLLAVVNHKRSTTTL